MVDRFIGFQIRPSAFKLSIDDAHIFSDTGPVSQLHDHRIDTFNACATGQYECLVLCQVFRHGIVVRHLDTRISNKPELFQFAWSCDYLVKLVR